ncbi:MAG: hypothetical protein IJL03_01435 [Lachnospiraceae bacterium]|nr:hypothetical protein [Lachnospiraceae bacterium]
MNRDKKNHNRLLIVSVIVFSLVFFGLLTYAIWDNIVSEKSIIRLGDYSSLTYNTSDRDKAGTEVTDLVVSRTRFGGLIKKEAEKMYEATMKVYQEEAEYNKISLAQYIDTFFGTTEEKLRKDVKASALQVAKEEAVLDAIAERENITVTAYQFEKLLADYMDSVGYTDREQFLTTYDENQLREQMRRELTVDWLLEHASGPQLESGTGEEE